MHAAQPGRAHTARKLGLALGGGAALGLAHIGVIRVFEDHDLAPDVVAGTSIGAIVGAAYVFGVLDRLEEAACSLSWLDVMRLTDFRLGKRGFVSGKAIVKEMTAYIGEATFADADRPFAVVASDLASNHEVTLKTGRVVDALRASISIPGIFPPVERDGRILIDGGIKNPVPISTCHELGAEIVVAVDVTGDYAGQAEAAGMSPGQHFQGGLYEVASMSVAMIMNQIGRANFALNPPDVSIVPKIGHVRPYQFKEGEELIKAGRDAALSVLADIDGVVRGGSAAG